MRRATFLVIFFALAATSPATAQEVLPEIVAPASRDVTPPGVTPGPSADGPLVREPVPPPPPEPPRWRRFHLPMTSDAATFRVDDKTIRIAGVAAEGAEATCRRTEGGAWPCGRAALHALRMFLRGRAIECFFPHADTAIEITAPCRVGRTDLGLWLLTQGWAAPGQYATEAYRRAAQEARCGQRGLWRGAPPAEPCPEPETP